MSRAFVKNDDKNFYGIKDSQYKGTDKKRKRKRHKKTISVDEKIEKRDYRSGIFAKEILGRR